jgi:TorA maturation chaperone TorD
MENHHVHVHQSGGKAEDVVKRGRSGSPELAFERSKIYKLFSYLFSYPGEELFGFIKDGELFREMDKALQGIREKTPHLNSAQTILDSLFLATQRLASSGIESLRDEYAKLFESSRQKSLLYEAHYLDFPQEEMADIAGFYRAFGFTFEGRPDHLGAELEFMHLLTTKEAKAAWDRKDEQVEVCRDGQRKFLAAHLGRWIDGLPEKIEHRKGLCYRDCSSALKEWLNREARHLGITIQGLKDAGPREAGPEMEVCPAADEEGRRFGEL